MRYVEANAAQAMPIVISSTAVIPKSPSQLASKYIYIKMQKSVVLGTCSIVRNFINYETTVLNPVDY
jgi:hypothetical protein